MPEQVAALCAPTDNVYVVAGYVDFPPFLWITVEPS